MIIYTIEPRDTDTLVWWLGERDRMFRKSFKSEYEAQLWVQIRRELKMR